MSNQPKHLLKTQPANANLRQACVELSYFGMRMNVQVAGNMKTVVENGNSYLPNMPFAELGSFDGLKLKL